MKQLTLFLLMLCSSLELFAQSKPLYVVAPMSGSQIQSGQSPFSGLINVAQCIYYHSDFPGIPMQGQITDVYIKMGAATPKGATLRGLTVKMKPSGLSVFSYNYHVVNNVIETGLTTVFYDSNYVLKDSLAYGDWWRLTLPVPYDYSFISGGDSARNLLVEFSLDSTRFPTNEFNTLFYGTNGSDIKFMDVVKIANNISYMGLISVSMIIGFNPKPDPVGVKEVSNMQLTVYPNPARATIHFSINGSYTISTLQGAIVQQGEGDVANIASLSQGLYIVQLTTKNGERLVGRFLKE